MWASAGDLVLRDYIVHFRGPPGAIGSAASAAFRREKEGRWGCGVDVDEHRAYIEHARILCRCCLCIYVCPTSWYEFKLVAFVVCLFSFDHRSNTFKVNIVSRNNLYEECIEYALIGTVG